MDNHSKLHNNEYAARLNPVIDYINENLDQVLSLEKMAKIACYSQFHFHRLFRTVIGETINKYIQRLRVEKAAVQLILNPKKTITEIALDCGFSSSQSLAKVFNHYFKMSASKWRTNHFNISKIEHTSSKIREETDLLFHYYYHQKKANNMYEPKVQIKNLPDMHVAYVRHIGSYIGNSELFRELLRKLFKWGSARELFNASTKVIALYNDVCGITEDSKLQLSVCATVPENTITAGNIGKLCIKGGRYAVFHFELLEDEIEAAWLFVYGDWLPESDYQPDDKPAFEILHNDPKKHPENKHILDICLPIIPL